MMVDNLRDKVRGWEDEKMGNRETGKLAGE